MAYFRIARRFALFCDGEQVVLDQYINRLGYLSGLKVPSVSDSRKKIQLGSSRDGCTIDCTNICDLSTCTSHIRRQLMLH